MENKYGYKVCYQKESEKPKIKLVTNTYDAARWGIEWLEKHPPNDSTLQNAKWYIIPIKNYLEYSKLWRGCPFRDYLSDLNGYLTPIEN